MKGRGGLCSSALSNQWEQSSSEAAHRHYSKRHILPGGLRGKEIPQPSPLELLLFLTVAIFLSSLALPKEATTVQDTSGYPSSTCTVSTSHSVPRTPVSDL